MYKNKLIDLNIIPIKTYFYSLGIKNFIFKENGYKSGVYCWSNTITGKIYVGSAINLTKRFYMYLSTENLERYTQQYNSYIYRAILKYGHDNFSLSILKYCDATELIKWEQYYIDKLKPEYNILKFAGSSTGFRHTAETILKIHNTKVSKGIYKDSGIKQGNVTIILDKQDMSINKFYSITEASRNLGINRKTIQNYANKGILHKNKYLFVILQKLPELNFEFEVDNTLPKRLTRIEKLNTLKPNLKKIFITFVINIATKVEKRFLSVREAAKYINIHHSHISKCLNRDGEYVNKNKGYYVYRKEIRN
uniref:GIY-YIG endonuclease n=1 Tax=Fusarium ficicrescens TaxID=1688603 RepID=A0A6M4B4P0_9HYPO|nr:GIY-YIG endonuclease [Fusarium ficicrescens]